MGEGMNLNPIVSAGKKKTPLTQTSQLRKTNKNKKHDIKIPVSEKLDSIIRREAVRSWNGSKTTICTDIFLFGLQRLYVYPEVKYADGPITVHVKVEHDVYVKLGEYAAAWRCSMRQAAHRIFMEAIKKKQIGGIGE